MAAVIKSVEPGSYAELHGIKPGCTLLKINGNEIVDVLDYRFFMMDKVLKVVFKTPDGRLCIAKIEKDDEYDDIGLEFETYLIDKQHSCNNKCIFCFVDQLPDGMRESLYFKDDDSRMSFFYGNYVTLTNMSDEDVERIIKMHISPINISIHTMNPELRCKMMNNRFAGESLKYLRRFVSAGIKINAQIVICPGINDGEELKRSILELSEISSSVLSVACVPVGLTKYRDNLPKLRSFTRDEARKTVELINSLGNRFKSELGTRFCYASDELYLLSGLPIPYEDYYEDYPQLDNGVGLLRLFESEVLEGLRDYEPLKLRKPVKFTIATGVASYAMMIRMASLIEDSYQGMLRLKVISVENIFFGTDVTVTGLLTGEDIMRQIYKEKVGKGLFLSKSLLKADEDILLDDVSVSDLEEYFGVPIHIVENDGHVFLDEITKAIEEVK